MVSETARLLASQYELLYFALIMLGACTGAICLTILIGANRIADALTANAKREQTQLVEAQALMCKAVLLARHWGLVGSSNRLLSEVTGNVS